MDSDEQLKKINEFNDSLIRLQSHFEQSGVVHQILEQTKKTNGRVDANSEQLKLHAKWLNRITGGLTIAVVIVLPLITYIFTQSL